MRRRPPPSRCDGQRATVVREERFRRGSFSAKGSVEWISLEKISNLGDSTWWGGSVRGGLVSQPELACQTDGDLGEGPEKEEGF